MAELAAYKKIHAPMLSVIASGLLLIASGLSILFNYQLLLVTSVLAAFLFISAVTIHNFWVEKDAMSKQVQMAHFLKNIAFLALILMINRIADWSW